MAKKKILDEDVEYIDVLEEEDEGFFDGDEIQGTVISSFSFDKSADPASSVDSHEPQTNALDDNRKVKTEANIATPSIDGEPYTIGRYYKLRYSTAKMLNEIKASHSDVNVYMNSIVDEAIRYYYAGLFQGSK